MVIKLDVRKVFTQFTVNALVTRDLFVVANLVVCVLYLLIVDAGDNMLSDELQSVLSHRHLLELIIERCSDVAPRCALCDAVLFPVLYCEAAEFTLYIIITVNLLACFWFPLLLCVPLICQSKLR